ncbi:PHP domain-containing protein [Cyanobium sp. Morenito 9A2]|uniref:PHP domain-containing protein n=1 Tax=Cyanobium sp. Morenito 9A2 TaxID=2823718 RepID=UPI0020CFDCE6|nr:PHP domain-containing protein [Cyanobium sp. Morenito 9A2]MCP9850069.1 PHP domain-containing protein [Cyanobium sp. Morenito 9A2]
MPHPLAAVLAQVTAESCPQRFNFHCHSTCSDGSLRPERLARQALDRGLEHLAVTDHHSLGAHGPIQALFDQERQQGRPVPVLWTGVEISCLLEGCLVHVLALGFDPGHGALQPYLQGHSVAGKALRAEAVRAAIASAGGLALLAHPARYRLPHQRLIKAVAALGFDGAEAWYDYGMAGAWNPTPVVCAAIDQQLADLGLLRSCGTDTHGLALDGR